MRGRVLSDATGCRGRVLTPSWDPSGTSEQCLQYYSPPCDRTLLVFCHSFWTFQHTVMFSHKLSAQRKTASAKQTKNQNLRQQQQCEQNHDVVQCCKFYRSVVTHVFHRKKQCNVYRSASRRFFGEKQQTFKKHTVKIKDSSVYIRRQI